MECIRHPERGTFTVEDVVFATGLGSGSPNTPSYPANKDEFEGEILHSNEHKKSSDHAGKTVVVGACTLATHDIAQDYYIHGVDTLRLSLAMVIDWLTFPWT